LRYQNINTVSFENVYGDKFPVKVMREYPDYQTAKKVVLKKEDRLDEIITRRDNYGDDAEGETYRVVDHNIVEIFESGFDLAKIKEIKIPTR